VSKIRRRKVLEQQCEMCGGKIKAKLIFNADDYEAIDQCEDCGKITI